MVFPSLVGTGGNAKSSSALEVNPHEYSASSFEPRTGTRTARLHRILTYRELGFPLEEIATILSDPDADELGHLRRQRSLLRQLIERLQRMVAAVEHAMEAHQMGIRLTPEERFEVFGDFDPGQYAAEAEERWGGTEAYRQSQQRVASWTKEDWQRVKSEGDRINRRLAEMYVTDQRFTDAIDAYGAGLAAYLRDAIRANAARGDG